MLWLYIIGGILLFIFVLLLFSAVLDITANNDEFYVDVKYIFFKFRVYPAQDKPKKEKKQKKEKNSQKKHISPDSENVSQAETIPEAKKTSKLKKIKKEKPKKQKQKESSIKQLKDILDLLEGTAKHFARLVKSIKIDLNLDLTVGGEDAAQTAVSFGKYNALVWGLIGQASAIMTVKPKVNINCDFNFNRILFNIKAKIKLRLLTAFAVGICILLRILVNTIKKEK